MFTDVGDSLVHAEAPRASQGPGAPQAPVALARSREEFLASASVGVAGKQVTREVIARLVAAHNVKDKGVELINRVVFGGQKVREPHSSMFSSLVAHVSPKLEEVATCESATVEYRCALSLDHLPQVLGVLPSAGGAGTGVAREGTVGAFACNARLPGALRVVRWLL